MNEIKTFAFKPRTVFPTSIICTTCHLQNDSCVKSINRCKFRPKLENVNFVTDESTVKDVK